MGYLLPRGRVIESSCTRRGIYLFPQPYDVYGLYKPRENRSVRGSEGDLSVSPWGAGGGDLMDLLPHPSARPECETDSWLREKKELPQEKEEREHPAPAHRWIGKFSNLIEWKALTRLYRRLGFFLGLPSLFFPFFTRPRHLPVVFDLFANCSGQTSVCRRVSVSAQLYTSLDVQNGRVALWCLWGQDSPARI